ncbi:MAG: biopolymer transporter ExbD, partial [Verrucomicrobiota bacterium]
MHEFTQTLARRQAGVHPTLVDLAFVLVFLFLILSTLADTRPAGETAESTLPPLDLPELDALEGDAPGEAHAVITLEADGSLLIDNTAIRIENMDTALANLSAQSVELRAAASVPYGQIAQMLGR